MNKKIGILTSGGDAPGMNAIIRAVVRSALFFGNEVVGIERGYQGLIEGSVRQMEMRSVSDIIQRGGTILRTLRCKEFATEEGLEKGLKTIKQIGIDGLVVIGGDGTFMGAKALSEHGIPTIGIPGTIDNDLGYTDYTIGFDTAVNTCLEVINKLRDTMTSHERISIIEVMGRGCGDIALHAGLGGGAEVIVVPECRVGVDDIILRLNASRAAGKVSGIIVLSEGADRAENMAPQLKAKTNFDVRTTVVGHMQRGGTPTHFDRLYGTRMGVHAVKLLCDGIGNRIIGIRQNKVYDIDIFEGLQIKKEFDLDLYNTAAIVSR